MGGLCESENKKGNRKVLKEEVEEKEETSSNGSFSINPLRSYDSFKAFIAKLNKLINANSEFIQSRFSIYNMHMSIVMSDNILPEKLKLKWFDCTIS
jgi:hypothetical protein